MLSAQVRVLGPVEVVGPHGPAALVGAKQRAVLALLALNAGTVVPQWRLVDALWGDPPPRTAVKSLQSHVARVRQALAVCGLPEVLTTRESGYALMLPPDTVDAWRFEQRVRQARENLADGVITKAADHLRDGLALWHHDVALADAEVTGWAEAELDRLSEVRLTALEDWWDAQLQLGRHDTAVGELDRLLVTHPLRERLVGLYMLALYRCDRHNTALQAYHRLRARLADEMGVDPGPDLTRLHTLILRRDPALRPQSGGPATVATVSAAQPAVPRPAQLPARVGHFTGRVHELATLDRLMNRSTADGAESEVQVAVISGPAGIGKTALAVQWAHRMTDRFRDGQLFVDLRGHEPESALSPADALSHMLRSLGVPADRIPTEPTEQASLYRSLLHSKQILILVDNGGTAEDILPLVPAGSANLLVVTSRHTMAALATHHAVCAIGLEVLDDGDAMSLLTKLVGPAAVQREPAAAAELIRLCDRMPLAIRIAAAKLCTGIGTADAAGRPLGTLAGELAGANRLDALAIDGGSRSVRAVFASAYRALRPASAHLFRLLGLHPGTTVCLQLAAAMADLPLALAREVIGELVNAHLVTEVSPGRLRLHDLIALFAHQCAMAECSAPAREEATARMLDWYLAVAAEANRIIDPGRDRVTPALRFALAQLPFPAEPEPALAFLESERANLLPVARFALQHGHTDVPWQLTYLLTGFYDSCGHWLERVLLCHLGVAAAQAGGDPATEGLMRSALGVAYIAIRRFDEALQSLYEALPLMRSSGDMRGVGHVHNNIAAAYSGLRRFGEAVDAFREALEVHTAHGHRLGIALALNNTGHTYVRMGKPELSSRDLTMALQISREIGNRRLEAAALHSLGEADLRGGAAEGALDHFGAALAVYQEMGDRQYQAETLHGIGLAYLTRGEPATATGHLHRALTLAHEIADPHLEAIVRHALAQAYLSAGELAAARTQLDLALAARVWVPDTYEEANLHRDLGELEQRCGDPESAAYHWELAVRLYQKVNATDEADELAARLT
ncbi:SARP family transcriptional regulator [Rhizocola hellebori]|uniref:SARP family transcriptional regulator n=1 Tax=Rhizocola hellebori TaxID=1392758 RepID=A0A8J3QK29_9ACTN|nr:BTAD domain-containing putative transcriptional regulator [Rhizocola hellebori]GIH11522.1 SARP family transcriptional regulator [Rhizocola hellebori]